MPTSVTRLTDILRLSRPHPVRLARPLRTPGGYRKEVPGRWNGSDTTDDRDGGGIDIGSRPFGPTPNIPTPPPPMTMPFRYPVPRRGPTPFPRSHRTSLRGDLGSTSTSLSNRYRHFPSRPTSIQKGLSPGIGSSPPETYSLWHHQRPILLSSVSGLSRGEDVWGKRWWSRSGPLWEESCWDSVVRSKSRFRHGGLGNFRDRFENVKETTGVTRSSPF